MPRASEEFSIGTKEVRQACGFQLRIDALRKMVGDETLDEFVIQPSTKLRFPRTGKTDVKARQNA